MHDTDRRVIYTRKQLRDSLLKLMENKPVGSISVTELCKCAGVNRGTFYSHYRQPEDVLTQIEDELFTDIKGILGSMTDLSSIHREIVHVLYKNREACRLLISENGAPGCIERILSVSADYFYSKWKSQLDLSEAAAGYIHSFISSGTVAVLREWLTNDNLRDPDEIADIISELHRRILPS